MVHRCGHCGKIMKSNINFCSMDCQVLYFEKINKIRIGTWINKKKRRIGLSDILSEENLKAMIKETERSIDKKMNKLKR